MARSPLFDQIHRSLRIALFAERTGLSTSQALDRVSELEARRLSRRDFFRSAGTLAVAGAATGLAGRSLWAFGGKGAKASVGIVGAGLAGLTCADTLRKNGFRASLYDAGTRTGGRCWSLRDFFPGQVCERGGELIDNLHKTMIGYAMEFGLTLEDVGKQPGEVFYHFRGQRVPESVVVDEWRAFVPALGTELRALSGDVTALAHTDEDVRIDNIDLASYIDGANGAGIAASQNLREAIQQSYIAEYGRDLAEQSCLNMIMFIHADRRSKFTPFGVFSDERYHVLQGNDRIVEGISNRLSGQIELGMNLVRVRKTSTGYELTFKSGNRTVTRVHDAVVLAIPFTVLREVELDASLAIPEAQVGAIRNLGYGNNAKMMVGFTSRPWAAQGGNGASYSDLTNHQATWETNPKLAGVGNAIITDYSSAARGARLDPSRLQSECDRFLTDFDKVVPGAKAAARKDARGYMAHLEAWPRNPLTKGSYTCYLPGQFTSVAGLEGRPVGNLHFAGEHTNSFYEWQGFMEGACLSGIQAASEILADVKAGRV